MSKDRDGDRLHCPHLNTRDIDVKVAETQDLSR